MNRILEFYGFSTRTEQERNWAETAATQYCPFLNRKCVKIRKSEPEKSIGTCSVEYGKARATIIICPHRLLERNQIFVDCLHLLSLHEPGNALHIVSEVSLPGGSVDYFLVSARDGSIKDFVGIELQSLDTTGTIWPERQELLKESRGSYRPQGASRKPFGMNWKMTAKTILMQLHHKIQTFELLNKHLVLILQDHFLEYIRQSFSLEHLEPPKVGNSMHIHCYSLKPNQTGHFSIDLVGRFSTME